jgi:hypothetical protein
MATDQAFTPFIAGVADRARAAGVFSRVETEGGVLRCHAPASAEPAWYALFRDGAAVYIALQTPARYLSQSIEQDLVHTGDKIEDLLQEELTELGHEGPALRVEHFRDEQKLYTFRSALSPGASVESAAKILLAYEACFRHLGDMEAGED